ncbi:bifunctional folylpolyglutamate synthase/dihydrofolate synthase [Fibrisoma montanum]|uniref:Dihydrofolate synthase/folylpolyglutamate synthase n=1 Tax=Fibrisoma montanum TaxID=2305895 RepID=A0A418MAU8_9BACT|nr:folylpolyglutamate synthase/dihydrofolate synthase family protein [Fibrisoma montanum]RIV23499.1 bifunctional folylpolyglutamate synthase/dihydrofolate synthase [Fibrisoma montanum]
MNYSESLAYLYSRLPVFHRIGAKALKPGLANIERLSAALGNPHQLFRSIHVAGTNGKGSTSHMLASIYQSAGYRVGLYTSPHLKSFTERIRLNGTPIAEADVAEFVTTYQSLIEAVEPSFFEVTVAMAFDYFARQQVDLAVIEVGLGGRLDSTNIITPELSVITNISFDHQDVLGDTLPQIAGEKAGIIKPGVPVVISETQAETKSVFQTVADQQQARITFADQVYTVVDDGLVDGVRQVRVTSVTGQADAFVLDLTGPYQVRNLPGVLGTVDQLQTQWPVGRDAVAAGLAAVVKQTGLQGRFQRLNERPIVLADTAHNQAGIQAVLTAVDSIPHRTVHLVIGMVADKDRSAVLRLLPSSARYYFCQAQTPRSLPADVLQREAAELGLAGEAFIDVNEALDAAIRTATTDDLILITGSNYIIAELTDKI